MEQPQQEKLLRLARAVLENRLYNSQHDLESFREEAFQEQRGVFVTLHLNGELKGCIGHIEASTPLYENVVYLSQAAAFDDPRFPSLTAAELKDIQIEISVLTVPVKLSGKQGPNLVAQIRPGIDGVILYSDYHHATFLPQVWEQLPARDDFMHHLCLKAGLPGDHWKTAPIEIAVYQVESFSEPV